MFGSVVRVVVCLLLPFAFIFSRAMKRLLPFFLLFVCFIPSQVTAQSYPHWQLVASARMSVFKCPYFITSKIGWLYDRHMYQNASVSMDPLYRTLNGGNTWDTLRYFSDQRLQVSELYFDSPTHGYAAVSLGVGGVYETTDVGNTWRLLKGSWPSLSIYASHGHLFAGSFQRLYASNNNGSTWDTVAIPSYGKTRIQFSGCPIAGNRDSLVATIFVDPNDDSARLLLTTDLGNSWHIHTYGGVEQLPYLTLYSFAHTKDLLLEHDGEDVSRRDEYELLGWHEQTRTIDSSLSAEISSWFAGRGCVVYAVSAQSGGVFRSTDRGTSWKEIYGPNNSEIDDREACHISTAGHGAVVYLVDEQGQLYKSIDGGDGTLSELTLGPQLSLAHDSSAAFGGCATAQVQILVRNAACEKASLQQFTITGLASDEWELIGDTWLQGLPGPDTLTIRLHQHTAHKQLVQFSATYTDDEFDSTTLIGQFTLDQTAIPRPTIVASTRTIDFGGSYECAPPVCDTILLFGNSCRGFGIDSIWMAAPADFSFVAQAPYQSLTDSTSESIVCTFHPLHTGLRTGSIFIKSLAGIDTIALQGTGLIASKMLDVTSSVLSTSRCDSATGTVAFANNSCAELLIDSTQIPPPFYFDRQQLPAVVPSGSSLQLVVRYLPAAVGTDTGTAHVWLHWIDGHNVTAADSSYEIIGSAARGTLVLQLDDSILDFGSVNECQQAAKAVHFASTGCDSLRVSGMYSVGDSSLSIDSRAVVLAPGASDSIVIHCIPRHTGTIDTYATLQCSAGQREVHIIATVIPATTVLELSSTALQFSPITACDSSIASVDLTNAGCTDLTLDSIGKLASEFTVASYRTGILARDSSRKIAIQFLPVSSGTANDSLKLYFRSASGQPHDTTITLRAEATPVPTMVVTLPQTAMRAADGDTIAIPMQLHGVLDHSEQRRVGVSSLNVAMVTNFDVLAPIDFVGKLAGISASSVVLNHDTLSLDIHTDSEFMFQDGDMLGSLRFRTLLSDTLETSLRIISCQVHASRVGQCIAPQSSGTTLFELRASCGDSLLSRSMQGVLPFAIAGVYPNPSSSNLRVDVIKRTNDIAIGYQLLDILGNISLAGNWDSSPIEVSEIPNGVYVLRLQSGAHTLSRRIIIQH